MSAVYTPGQQSRQYGQLPPAERSAVAAEVDRIFRERTGVTRALDPKKDPELVRTWLRIRDEVMGRRGGGTAPSKVPGPRASDRLLITGSVGAEGHNYEKDVILVKFLLDEIPDHLLYDAEERMVEQPDGTKELVVKSLVPDGVVTLGMIDRIIRLQRRLVGLTKPDGRIEPGTKTMQVLLLRFLHTGQVMRLRSTEGRLHPDSIFTITGGPMMLDGLQFRRGHVVNGLEGKRLILSITAAETIFMLLDLSGPGSGLSDLNPMRGGIGGVYAQDTEAFVDEYVTYFYRHLADELAPLATMIEAELNLLAAIGTTLTGTAIFYAGFTVSDFIARNRYKFKHWYAIVEAILEARSELKRFAPTLYDNLFDALFGFYGRSLTLENVAAVIGKIIGLGGQALLKGKFNVLASAGSLILSTVLMLLKNIPDSLQRADELWKRGIRALVADLRSQGVELTLGEEVAIYLELRANPKEIERIFRRLMGEINKHIGSS